MDVLLQAPVITHWGALITTFILGFTTVLLLLWYSYRKLDYWKEKCVPFVKSYPVFGSVWDNLRTPLHEVELQRYKKYGRIYGHFEGHRPVISIGDAEMLRDILVKDFNNFTSRREFATGDVIIDNVVSVLNGDDWKRVRTIITPTFSTGKLKRMFSILEECSTTLVKNFKNSTKGGEPVEVTRLYSAFTMDVIASAAFSTKLDSYNDPNNMFVSLAKKVFQNDLSWRFILFIALPKLSRFLRVSIFSPKVMQFFSNLTLQIIDERKKTGQTRNDFLQLLMDIAKETSKEKIEDSKDTDDDIIDNYVRDENDVVFKYVISKRSLSQEELISQCVAFFLAGYATSAASLSFTSYLLALNPDIQEKLIQKIDKVLKDNNGKLTYEALHDLKYLDNVIAESLRIFPPAIRTERQADQDYILRDTGITIAKGMIVTIPTYAMHRDPEYFPDPEKFDPDRFNPEERSKRNPYSYIPFGAGPRHCIGMRFALMEMKICLVNILTYFRFKKCPETKEKLEFYTNQGMLQPIEIFLKLEKRTDAVNDAL